MGAWLDGAIDTVKGSRWGNFVISRALERENKGACKERRWETWSGSRPRRNSGCCKTINKIDFKLREESRDGWRRGDTLELKRKRWEAKMKWNRGEIATACRLWASWKLSPGLWIKSTPTPAAPKIKKRPGKERGLMTLAPLLLKAAPISLPSRERRARLELPRKSAARDRVTPAWPFSFHSPRSHRCRRWCSGGSGGRLLLPSLLSSGARPPPSRRSVDRIRPSRSLAPPRLLPGSCCPFISRKGRE